MATSPYVTIPEAARYVQVTTQTIRNWIGKGLLTGYRAGPRQIRVNLAELERMFKTIPATKARDGRRVYGPNATIKPMPVQAYDPEAD